MHQYYQERRTDKEENVLEVTPKKGTKRKLRSSSKTEAASIPLKTTPAKKRQKR